MATNYNILLACALAGAAIYAVVQRPQSPPVRTQAETNSRPPDNDEVGNELPPDHPPIGNMATGAPPVENDGPPALTWTAPQKWTTAANASSMRLATYHVPAASAAPDEAELTVVRAGGSTDANLERWTEQFRERTSVKRSDKTVHGLKIAIIEVQGTFASGGMMPGQAAAPRNDWMLKGAVVETPAGSYFFKLTGPAASVTAASKDFDALMESVAPAPSSPK